MSAEEALSRAKAIAARLSGQDAGSSDTSPPKRKRWGVAPPAAKKARPDEASKRLWVSTTNERPEGHYFSYFQERLPALARECSSEEDEIRIELKGRGSTNQPPLPGIPEEPMHIMMYGPEARLTDVERKVDALMMEADRAPPEAAPQKDTDKPAANSLALTTTGNGGYRPATVAQLISNNPINNLSGPLTEETIHVPNGMVGYLIGRGGETITSLQAQTGCKVQIQKEHELKPGQTHRVITLQATSQSSIDECRARIEKLVAERGQDPKVTDAITQGHALVTVDVPDADVGLIIGKGGATIHHIQESTGASIQIPPRGNMDNPSVRTVQITHPHEEGANAAKEHITSLLKSKPSFANKVPQGPQVTLQVMVSKQVSYRCMLVTLDRVPSLTLSSLFSDSRQGCWLVYWPSRLCHSRNAEPNRHAHSNSVTTYTRSTPPCRHCQWSSRRLQSSTSHDRTHCTRAIIQSHYESRATAAKLLPTTAGW